MIEVTDTPPVGSHPLGYGTAESKGWKVLEARATKKKHITKTHQDNGKDMLNIPVRASKEEPHWRSLNRSSRTSQSAFEMSKHAKATAGSWVNVLPIHPIQRLKTTAQYYSSSSLAFYNQLSFRAIILAFSGCLEVTDLTQALLFSCRLFEISHSRTYVSAAILVWQALHTEPLISATSKDWFVR